MVGLWAPRHPVWVILATAPRCVNVPIWPWHTLPSVVCWSWETTLRRSTDLPSSTHSEVHNRPMAGKRTAGADGQAFTGWGVFWTPGGWFNIKMLSYQYRKSHCGDKTILRPSHLHNGPWIPGKYRCKLQKYKFTKLFLPWAVKLHCNECHWILFVKS